MENSLLDSDRRSAALVIVAVGSCTSVAADNNYRWIDATSSSDFQAEIIQTTTYARPALITALPPTARSSWSTCTNSAAVIDEALAYVQTRRRRHTDGTEERFPSPVVGLAAERF